MGELLRIKPKSKHPVGKVFEVPDKFNGPERGTWWFIDRYSQYHGPFKTEGVAQESLSRTIKIEPFSDHTGVWWWTDERGNSYGPYIDLRDADAAIVAHLNKDTQ